VCLATAGRRTVSDNHGMYRRHWCAAVVLACMRMMNQPAVAAEVPASSARGHGVCSGPRTSLGVPGLLSWYLVTTTSVGAGLLLQHAQLHVKRRSERIFCFSLQGSNGTLKSTNNIPETNAAAYRIVSKQKLRPMWHFAHRVSKAREASGIHPYPLLTTLHYYYPPAKSISRHGQRHRVPALSRSEKNISCLFLDMSAAMMSACRRADVHLPKKNSACTNGCSHFLGSFHADFFGHNRLP